MNILTTSIADIILLEPKVFQDERGFFMETFQANKFAEAGIGMSFVQDNHSGSRKGTLRGLHFQHRQPQGKLVRVTMGHVFDVAVDIRPHSATFGKWVGFHLSAENKLQAWIPCGFAHGFYVMSEWAEVSYKVTDFYCPGAEQTLLWNDSQIKIDWPLGVNETPILSSKDAQGRHLRDLVRPLAA